MNINKLMIFSNKNFFVFYKKLAKSFAEILIFEANNLIFKL